MLFIKTDHAVLLRAMLVPWPFSKSQQLSSFLLAELNFNQLLLQIHLHLIELWSQLRMRCVGPEVYYIMKQQSVTKAKCRRRKKMAIDARVALRFVVSLCKWAQNSPEAWFVENWVLASHHFVSTYFHCCGSSHCDVLKVRLHRAPGFSRLDYTTVWEFSLHHDSRVCAVDLKLVGYCV